MNSKEFRAILEEQKWPQEFRDKLDIGSLESNIGIATLWTQRELVCSNLDKNSYCVVGNFYDRKNGIEPLVRNCLANPNIRYIIIVGNDRSGSKEVLLKFFSDGLDDSYKIIGTDTRLSKSIPIEDINELRNSVKLIDLTSKISNLEDSNEYAKVITEAIKELKQLEPYNAPRFYQKVVQEVNTYPSEKAGFVIRGQYIGETWLKILRTVYDYGAITKKSQNSDVKLRGCINLVSVIEDEDPGNPKMEEYFTFTKDYLLNYYNEICTKNVPKGSSYTYGSKLRAYPSNMYKEIDQIADMIEFLKRDNVSKAGVAITWIPDIELTRTFTLKERNSPCINLVQCFVQGDELFMTSYIRSNDMFRAWPLNAFGLRNLQSIIAKELNVKIGKLTIISCSAHIYEDNWQDTKELINKYSTSTNCFFDHRGYYVIEINGGKIRATHFSPDGNQLKVYEGLKAREINDRINSSQHTVDSYHASYLGEELMKAQIALELGIEYIQDKALVLNDVKSCDTSCSTDNKECNNDSCNI